MSDFLLFATERYAQPILQPLADALTRAGHRPHWFLAGNARSMRLPEGECVSGVRAARALAPRAVFCAANWVPHMIPGAKVQVFHGFNVEKREADRGHFRIRGLFDLYCTQGPATTGPFRELALQHGHFAVVETGWPKLDPLFLAAPEAARRRRDRGGKPVVLYAATFTERLTSAPHLYDTIAGLVRRGDRQWLLSLHPKCAPELIAKYRALSGEHARFVEPEDLVQAEREADLLVCDTSSVIPECVVQGKPVVTFRNRSPQSWMLDIGEAGELDAAVTRATNADAAWREALEREVTRIHPWRDGHSSERVLAATDALLRGELGPLSPKPRNLWRKLQIRWDLGWFGPGGVSTAPSS